MLIITLLVRTYDVEVKTLLNPFAKYEFLGKEFVKEGWKCFSKNERSFTEILLNILLFVPLGFPVPTLQESFRKWWKVLLLGLGFSLFIECSQLVLHMGCFDTADLVHNTLGAGVGFVIWEKIMDKMVYNAYAGVSKTEIRIGAVEIKHFSDTVYCGQNLTKNGWGFRLISVFNW